MQYRLTEKQYIELKARVEADYKSNKVIGIEFAQSTDPSLPLFYYSYHITLPNKEAYTMLLLRYRELLENSY